MPKIADNQIVAGVGPADFVPKFAPTTGNLVSSRIKDDDSSIDLTSLLVNIGDFINALNGSHLFIDDVNRVGRFGVGNSATSRALVNMDCESAAQLALSAIEGALTASLSLRPNSSAINLAFSPSTSGTINLTGGLINLNGVSVRKNDIQIGVVYSAALLAQTTSIPDTNVLMDGGSLSPGLYRLSYYLVTTVAGTSGTVKAVFDWIDVSGEVRIVESATITFGTLATPASGTLVIQYTSDTGIGFQTVVAAAVGDPQYALYVTLERLQ